MDALSQVLQSVRLTGAVFFNAEFRSPWGFVSPRPAVRESIRNASGDRIVVYHLVREGQAVVHLDGSDSGETIHLTSGDLIICPHGDPHRMSNGHAVQWYDTGPSVERALTHGDLSVVRHGGDGPVTRFVCGYFGCERYASQLFLAGLPSLIKLNIRANAADDWLERSIGHAVMESESDRPGRFALLAKLSETLFVEALRLYMNHLGSGQTGWLAAARDDVVGRALAVIHSKPAAPWTVASLADASGTSRSVLTERFTHFLTESPMTYLARWRLQLGARLLETTRRGIVDIAGDVGYESQAAFNRAFKREFDVAPGAYRRSHGAES